MRPRPFRPSPACAGHRASSQTACRARTGPHRDGSRRYGRRRPSTCRSAFLDWSTGNRRLCDDASGARHMIQTRRRRVSASLCVHRSSAHVAHSCRHRAELRLRVGLGSASASGSWLSRSIGAREVTEHLGRLIAVHGKPAFIEMASRQQNCYIEQVQSHDARRDAQPGAVPRGPQGEVRDRGVSGGLTHPPPAPWAG